MALSKKRGRWYRRLLSKLGMEHRFCEIAGGGPHGDCEIYYGGLLYEKGTYEYGIPSGPFRRYHDNGQVKEKFTFRHGKIEGPWEEYHDNGQLAARVIYQNGEQEGLYERYFDDGHTIEERGFYEKGEREGFWVQYHRSGALKMKKFYQDGERYGLAEYDENGGLIRVCGSLDFELTGESAEEILKRLQVEEEKAKAPLVAEKEKEKEKQRQEKIKSLKDQLEKATNPEDVSKAVGLARTPERKAYAERIVKTRRAKSILFTAAHKAKSEGDEELLQEIMEIAKPYAGQYAAMRDKTRRKRLQNKRKIARE